MHDIAPQSQLKSASAKESINIEIEYLRAVAILLVVVLHSHALLINPFKTHVSAFILQFVGAWTGVDLFFCISGYVISRSFQPFFDRHRTDDRWLTAACAFWVRRIFRLVPSAWLWLFIGVACSWLFDPSSWFMTFDSNLRSAPLVMLNVANIAAGLNMLAGNGVYWTLALEDQFYLLFPLFLLFFRGRWRWGVLLALIVVQALPSREMHAHPFLWHIRADALMWGCLIYQFSKSAEYWRWEPTILRSKSLALLSNSAIVFVLSIMQILPIYHQPTFRDFRVESVVALASAAFVFLASFDRGYVLPLPNICRTTLAWIGSRSYALYLIHIPLYGVIREVWLRYAGEGHSDWAYDAYCIVLIMALLPVLAELNFRYVETPLRRKGKRIARRMMDGPQIESRLVPNTAATD